MTGRPRNKGRDVWKAVHEELSDLNGRIANLEERRQLLVDWVAQTEDLDAQAQAAKEQEHTAEERECSRCDQLVRKGRICSSPHCPMIEWGVRVDPNYSTFAPDADHPTASAPSEAEEPADRCDHGIVRGEFCGQCDMPENLSRPRNGQEAQDGD